MSKSKTENSLTLNIIKGIVVGLVISLILTLALALLTSFTEIGDAVINPLQTITRQVALVVATFVAVSKEHRGWLTGLLTGIFFSMVAFIVFSLIGGSFVFDQTLGLSILFSSLIGMISGIIFVNIKK